MAFYFVSTFANAQTPTKQRPYGYRGLKIITSLRLRFPDFQRLTAMSYNLMRVFEEISKTQQPELIHPSDKKYSEALEIRQQQAQKRDRFVNPLFFQARISRISSYTIRAVQNAIITGMSLQCFMSSLVARLVSRPQLIGGALMTLSVFFKGSM
ncbi:hypothetical protein [Bathymodiolus platifrons methanotrophic gill symbiont]|uniref:hypothetical protein n=1 Tax=Bathymodiolus platifrons methanotrophic gill symbiont TaxID=113268 RepID=UPI001C8E8869|nr:hypothetical protein [Bathymodiolus platifrons methanotrophic gill symbiont]